MAIIKPNTLSLAGSDFTRIVDPGPNVIALIFGLTGEGKSYLVANNAPDPICYFNFDGRANNVIYEAEQNGKVIAFKYIPCPIGIIEMSNDKAKAAAKSAVDAVHRNFIWALDQAQRGNIKTICLDTGTEWAEILRVSITGQLKPLNNDYGTSEGTRSLMWRTMYAEVRKSKVNFVVLAREKEIYSGREGTGRYEPKGPAVMEEGVDFTAQIRRAPRRKSTDPVEFEIEMTNPKLNISEMGAKYRKDDWGDMGGFRYACLLQGKTLGD